MNTFAIVDIETTGGSSFEDKITEIAIYLSDGEKVIDEFHSLVDPKVSIPPYITSITGIDNYTVEGAPVFADIADEVISMLKDSIFVAHNVNFDYHFVKNELKSSGYEWDSKKLCTVRYARKIFPGLPSYGLGKLADNLGFNNEARHRAFGDAMVTVEIFHLMVSKDSEGIMDKLINHGSIHRYIPPNLEESVFINLPELPGVYIFIDGKGRVLYVGKAINIRKRVKSHFTTGSGKPEVSFINEIHNIEHVVCGNELIALLHENELIKKYWPPFNKAQKFNSKVFSLISYFDGKGFIRHGVAQGRKPNLIMTFNSMMESRNYLFEIAREYQLCPKLLGLAKTSGPCAWVKDEECKGACCDHETPEEYNKRVLDWHNSVITNKADILILGEGRSVGETGFVVIKDNTYKGFGFASNENQALENWQNLINQGIHDADVQRILNQFFNHNSDRYRFLPL
ncbi:exonuclease domain-containing protein [Marinigracilibium pacificum]|uniref:GIY-YIG nuclease family protein n=1 Tax=Marinigracilibium pacificum TaxID=2729599 RepID=A0A848J1R7_9BACT|nr:exonuclease domain-containing protein [Marinigracilibium pacificum]NMM48414.1 GIY-YIG nuclease family protein [Marinigracilibium pacificum]